MNGTSAKPKYPFMWRPHLGRSEPHCDDYRKREKRIPMMRIGTILSSSGNFSNSVHGAAIVG